MFGRRQIPAHATLTHNDGRQRKSQSLEISVLHPNPQRVQPWINFEPSLEAQNSRLPTILPFAQKRLQWDFADAFKDALASLIALQHVVRFGGSLPLA